MKSVRDRKSFVFALLVSLAWLITPRAQAKNTITCTVVDESGNPVAKQEFKLTSAAGKESKKKTNGQGEVKFGGLDDGAYTLGAEIPGFVATKSVPIEVSGNTEKPCSYTVISADSANAKLKEVMQLAQQRKFTEAEDKAKKLVEMMPGLGPAHYVLAVAYAYSGNEQAEAEVKKAAELDPVQFNNKVVPIQMQLLNQQAEVAKQKRDYPAAIKKYESMAVLAPNDSTVYYNMAMAYASAKDYAKALANIDKALLLKPEDEEAKQRKTQFEKQFDEMLNKKLEK